MTTDIRKKKKDLLLLLTRLIGIIENVHSVKYLII